MTIYPILNMGKSSLIPYLSEKKGKGKIRQDILVDIDNKK